MSEWQAVVGVAAVGTERQEVTLPPAGGALGGALSRLDLSDREGALLAAVALASLHRRAGFRPATDPQSAPEACGADEVPRCSAESGQHLALMLGGAFKEVLPEWLAALRVAPARAPEEYLPALLEKGRAERALRPLIASVIGRRGRWLAAQNAEWGWAASAGAEDWETGGRDERLFLLRVLRETDPRGARQLIASTWKQEGAKDRQLFLESLLVGLNEEDEPFLTDALQDRSAEVRSTAAELLLRLPPSALRRLVSERVGSLVSYQKPRLGRARIEVRLPRDPEGWQKENQLPPDLPAGASAIRHAGKKGWWLARAVGWVPPPVWCGLWGKRPGEVLGAAANSEWKDALLAGLAAAAARHGDEAWAEAVLRSGYIRETIEGWDAAATELAERLPAARLEALVLEEFAAGKRRLRLDPPAAQLLLAHRAAWGDELSRAVVAGVKDRIAGGLRNELAEWQLRSALRQFALRVSPALSEELSAGWPTDAEGPWRDAAEEFLSVLRFRREALRAINEGGHNRSHERSPA